MTRHEVIYLPETSTPQPSKSPSPSVQKIKVKTYYRKSTESTASATPSSRSSADVATLRRPSIAPWADGPFQLISKPRVEVETAASFCATQMGLIHNIIIRGLNSVVRQAPYVDDASKPDYNTQNVKDLLFYVQAWCRNLDHHHSVEENTFFPLVEEATGVVGLMDDLEVEHEEFHGGVVALQRYAENMYARPDDYRWATMRTIISGFAPALINHLHAEIDFLLKMEKFEGADLRRCWEESGKVAEKVDHVSDFFDLFPFIIGNADKTHDGGNDFPPVPKPIRFAMQHWFAKRHRGAWRFNTCDYSGRPQPLQMIPEDVEA
jgi:hemerythrin-like domain-containing protein